MKQIKYFLLMIVTISWSNLFQISASCDSLGEEKKGNLSIFLETDAYRISDAYHRATSHNDFYGVSSMERAKPSYGSTLDSTLFFYCGFNNEILSETLKNVNSLAQDSMTNGSECFLFLKKEGVKSFCHFATALNRAHFQNQIKIVLIDFPSQIEGRSQLEASIKKIMLNDKKELLLNVVSLYFYPFFSWSFKIPKNIDYGIFIGVPAREAVSPFKKDLSKEGVYRLLLNIEKSWYDRDEAIENGFYTDQDNFLEHIGEVDFFTPQRETIMNSIKDLISGNKPILPSVKKKIILLCSLIISWLCKSRS